METEGVDEVTADQLMERFDGAIAQGTTFFEQRRRLILEIADALATYGDLPAQAGEIVSDTLALWRTSATPSPGSLTAARVRIWQMLDAKNDGNTTRIADHTDRSLRAALCITELEEPGGLHDSAGWAAEMLSTEPWPRATRYF